MWTRKELKEKGKTSFKRNYWKAVLVALIFSFIAGGFGGFSGSSSGASFGNMVGKNNTATSAVDNVAEAAGEAAEDAAEDAEKAVKEIEVDVEDIVDENGEKGVIVNVEDPEDAAKAVQEAGEILKSVGEDTGAVAFGVAMIFIFLIVFVVVLALAFALSSFLLNPIEMGCDRFFYRNLNENEEVAKNVLFAFDHNYINVVKTLFFRDLYICLWSLLFVIPGIVKAYEYRMIPYLLAENPGLTTKEAFAKSKAMMTGQKWRAFVLDLSFIGWELLSLLTCGILSVFYVSPYEHATNAALYEALRDKAGMDVIEDSREAVVNEA